MESRSRKVKSIDVKVMWCEDLKAFNFFQKLSVYAVVSITSDNSSANPPTPRQKQQQKRIPTDKEGNGNPMWNYDMKFDLDDNSDPDHLFLHFELRSETPLVFPDKSIGEVKVPLKDLIDEHNGAVRLVSYQVRTSDGKPNGVLNFSYKINEKDEKKPESFATAGLVDGQPAVAHLHHPEVEKDNQKDKDEAKPKEQGNEMEIQVRPPSEGLYPPIEVNVSSNMSTPPTTPQPVQYSESSQYTHPTTPQPVQYSSQENQQDPPHTYYSELGPPSYPPSPVSPTPFLPRPLRHPPWLHPPPPPPLHGGCYPPPLPPPWLHHPPPPDHYVLQGGRR